MGVWSVYFMHSKYVCDLWEFPWKSPCLFTLCVGDGLDCNKRVIIMFTFLRVLSPGKYQVMNTCSGLPESSFGECTYLRM